MLELANRLVLPRLINLIEKSVIQQMSSAGQEVFIEALELLEPCQVASIASSVTIRSFIIKFFFVRFSMPCSYLSGV